MHARSRNNQKATTPAVPGRYSRRLAKELPIELDVRVAPATSSATSKESCVQRTSRNGNPSNNIVEPLAAGPSQPTQVLDRNGQGHAEQQQLNKVHYAQFYFLRTFTDSKEPQEMGSFVVSYSAQLNVTNLCRATGLLLGVVSY
jgi:hypothetical protein